MTTSEFSDQFDVLLDSYRRFKAFDSKKELDSLEYSEYEKSVFLTQAQDNIVVGRYKGILSEAFEDTEDVTKYLSTLVKQCDGTKITTTGMYHIVEDSVIFSLPEDVLFKTYESCKVRIGNSTDLKTLVVIPVEQDEFWRTRRDPFKCDDKTRVLRLTYAGIPNTTNEYAELISPYEIDSYQVRYLSRPTPIVLVDLTADSLNIRGCSTVTECKLPEILHQEILNEAVRLAKSAWNI